MNVPVASSEKYKYNISWSAKCGCTTLRRLFLYLHEDELINGPTNQWHNLHQDFPSRGSEFKRTIMLSRNPYDRVVSTFTNKICGGIGHNTLSELIPLDQVTFKNFLLYISKNKIDDIHVKSQNYIVSLCKDHDTFNVKLENFNEDIIKAYQYFDLKDLIPKIKKFLVQEDGFKNETIRNENELFCGETIYSINRTTFPASIHFYNDELRKLVQEIYSADFEAFDYPM